MADFFKQLITQLGAIWNKLNLTQKSIILATLVITISGMVVLIAWSAVDSTESGNSTLFVGLSNEDASKVTEALKEMNVEYSFDHGGRSLMVPSDQLYEVRMQMARLGLPEKAGPGFGLFDKLQLGMTDFVQNLNYRRALEGEIARSIMTLNEIERARVHVNIPKPSLFTEQKEEATASVVIKIHPGESLTDRQVRGITHLLASSVEGLMARQVAVLDIHGNLLTRGFADNKLAEQADHNLMIQTSLEEKLENKVLDIFHGLLGPNKARVKVAVELDFDQVRKTIEDYDPASKVVRSQQRDDIRTQNSPSSGDEEREGVIVNYEIDKTVSNIISSPGIRKRVTVSVAVDGRYESKEEGKREFVERSPEELEKYRELVKNAVGFRSQTDDEVFVTCVQFDKDFIIQEKKEMEKMARMELFQYWGKVGVVGVVLVLAFLFLQGLARNLSAAMNPPVPKYAHLNLAPAEEEIPDEVKYQNELLQRVESLSREEPGEISNLIKNWLLEGKNADNGKEKGKKKKR